MDFTDESFIYGAVSRMLGINGTISSDTIEDIMNTALLWFFNAYKARMRV